MNQVTSPINVAIVSTAGGFSLRTTADTDARASADGSAVTADGGAAAIGVGVAVNYVRVINQTVMATGTSIDAHGVTVSATMSGQNEFAANASSGAGAGDVGIAGSVAMPR